MGFNNFFSFVKGLQEGYQVNNYPVLSLEDVQPHYSEAFNRFNLSYDIEKDILTRLHSGELDQWEAIEQLIDELSLPFDEAEKKVKEVLANPHVPTILSSMKKRKKSKYHGALVNTTFDSPHTGVSTVVPGGLGGSAISASGRIISGNVSQVPDIEDAPAYWISPDGGIFTNFGVHIEAVCENPSAFGLTKEYMKGVYDKFRERWGLEGLARDEIMKLLYSRGWVRIRYNTSIDLYSIELDTLTSKHKSFLWAWASGLLKVSGDKRKYSEVFISEHIIGTVSFKGSVLDLASDKLFNHFASPGILVSIVSSADFSKPELFVLAYEQAFSSQFFKEIKDHPSIRYFVASFMIAPVRKSLVRSSLCGSLDTFLYQNYMAGFGDRNPVSFGSDIKDVGDNGRVVLRFDTNSGHSTEVDLGANLDTGYVVESINDELGLFPEGTIEGDLLDKSVVQEIVKSQGERDRQDRIEKSDPPELDGEFVGSGLRR